jgi:hypothetical protein
VNGVGTPQVVLQLKVVGRGTYNPGAGALMRNLEQLKVDRRYGTSFYYLIFFSSFFLPYAFPACSTLQQYVPQLLRRRR